jgi:AbrB family looped-hinge helix DNA binding protein
MSVPIAAPEKAEERLLAIGMICMKSMNHPNNPTSKPKCVDWSHAFFGTATVGEKGQLVIPAEARAEFNMHPGDKLLIMRHPVHSGLMMFKFDAVKEFVDDFQRSLQALDEATGDGA